MKIAVIVRQVPDLIEPLEVADDGVRLDLDIATFLVNETDEHALEQAILMKERGGGEVVVVAFDFGDVDNTLFTAAARGADRIVKIPLEDDEALPPAQVMAAMLADTLKDVGADLVLIGSQSHDEMLGPIGPAVACQLDLPYLGVVCGVEAADGGAVKAFKEFPGAAKAALSVKLPAVLGILAAKQPPRYVPVSRIRAASKSAQFDEQDIEEPQLETAVSVSRLYAPEAAGGAEMIDGDEEAVAGRIAGILAERGVLK